MYDQEPQNPIHTAEMFKKLTQKLSINYRDKEEAALLEARNKRWLYILGGIGIIVILIFSTPTGKEMLASIGKQQVQQSAPIIKEVVKEVATNMTGAGVKL